MFLVFLFSNMSMNVFEMIKAYCLRSNAIKHYSLDLRHFSGGEYRSRTDDLLRARQAL